MWTAKCGCAPRVTAELAAIPDVVTVEEAASNRDLMLTVISPTLEQFTDHVLPRFKEIPGLLKYRTSLGTRLHSAGHVWRLNALDPAQQNALQALAGPRRRARARPRSGGPAAAKPPGPDSVPGP